MFFSFKIAAFFVCALSALSAFALDTPNDGEPPLEVFSSKPAPNPDYIEEYLDPEFVRVALSAQYSYGQCPCFRWVFRVQGLSGKVETKEFLISSAGLLQYLEKQPHFFDRNISRLATIGAVDALWKGGHIGLGFEGITVGNDADVGYSEIMRAGVYFLVNLVRNDIVRLDLRTIYRTAETRVDRGPRLQMDEVGEAAVLKAQGERWSGLVSFYSGFSTAPWGAAGKVHLSGAAMTRYAASRWDNLFGQNLELGVGLGVWGEHDAYRAELLGREANGITAGLTIDLSVVGNRILPPKELHAPK